MRTIFHVTTPEAWAEAQERGAYSAPSLEAEGFIHLSRPQQILGVLGRYYAGREGLLLLQVAQEKVTAPVKYEGAAADPFPHVYGRLNLDSVVGVHGIALKDGKHELLESLQLVGDTLLRAGLPGDEAEIASVHTHAWLQSYAGLIPEAFLSGRPLSFRQRMNWWRLVVSGADAASVFVAESRSHGIVAFCAVQAARDEELAGYGEVGAIYCLQEYKGKGIGAALFRRGLGHLAASGMGRVYLWVLEGNPTIEFYERMGGKRMGGREKTVDFGKPLKEVAYEWSGSDLDYGNGAKKR